MNDSESTCPHNHIIGDNNGETCANCGKQLAGYGYWGQFHTCIHSFSPVGDEPDAPRMCIYCEMWEEYPEGVAWHPERDRGNKDD